MTEEQIKEELVAKICAFELNLHVMKHYGYRGYCFKVVEVKGGYWTWDEDLLSAEPTERLWALYIGLLRLNKKIWH